MAFQMDNNSEGPSQPLSEINITPFVDVVLVLLIIFMVAAPMMQQGVEVQLPKTNSKSNVTIKENDVILSIDGKKNIFIGKTQVSRKELADKLQGVFKNKNSKELYLEADKSINYGFVVDVMATAKNAGIEKVGLVTEQDL
ncbi:MAG: protein TolR [Bdellovibrionota bacterium]